MIEQFSDRYDELDGHLSRIPGVKEPLPSSHNGARQTSIHTRSHHQHPAWKQLLSWPRYSSGRCHLYFSILILISWCCSFTTATATLPLSISNPLEYASEDFRSTLAQLAESGTIIVDHRPPPPVGNFWKLETVEEGIARRQKSGGLSSQTSSKATPPASSTHTAKSSKAASTQTSSSTVTVGTSSPIPLPSPFDSSLGANFTSQSCPNFINAFLSNATFKSCLPFSLLLESSNSFFQAEKSIVRITQTLDATCSADVTSCTTLMSALAANITSSTNCGADYAAQNPTVVQAYTGLIAYKPIYEASCLKNPATSSYCFAEAVTNASSPTDSYIYYIALNSSLPGGSQPTCSTCLQNTMAVFDAAAANRSQPVASTYVAAAQQINVQCGPRFVNASLPAPIVLGAASAVGGLSSRGIGFAVLVMCLLAWVF